MAHAFAGNAAGAMGTSTVHAPSVPETTLCGQREAIDISLWPPAPPISSGSIRDSRTTSCPNRHPSLAPRRTRWGGARTGNDHLDHGLARRAPSRAVRGVVLRKRGLEARR